MLNFLLCITLFFILNVDWIIISLSLCYCSCVSEFSSYGGAKIKGWISKESPNATASHTSGSLLTYFTSFLWSPALRNFFKQSGRSFMCALAAIGVITYCTIYDWNITWLEVRLPINTTNQRARQWSLHRSRGKTSWTWKMLVEQVFTVPSSVSLKWEHIFISSRLHFTSVLYCICFCMIETYYIHFYYLCSHPCVWEDSVYGASQQMEVC